MSPSAHIHHQTMLDIINHTNCPAQLATCGKSHTIRLDLGGDAISFRVPTSGIASRFGRGRWHDLASCTQSSTRRNRLRKHHEELDEKTQLIRGGGSRLRVKAYYKHVCPTTSSKPHADPFTDIGGHNNLHSSFPGTRQTSLRYTRRDIAWRPRYSRNAPESRTARL